MIWAFKTLPVADDIGFLNTNNDLQLKIQSAYRSVWFIYNLLQTLLVFSTWGFFNNIFKFCLLIPSNTLKANIIENYERENIGFMIFPFFKLVPEQKKFLVWIEAIKDFSEIDRCVSGKVQRRELVGRRSSGQRR